MQFATIETTLEFLQLEYAKYNELSKEDQEIIVEYSKSISGPPLRNLYIDLVMHDVLIQNSGQLSKEQLEPLIKEKIRLQQSIKQRETDEEAIIPVRVDETEFLELFDVSPDIHRLYLKWKDHKISSESFIKNLLKTFALRGKFTRKEFHTLFNTIEFVLRKGEKTC